MRRRAGPSDEELPPTGTDRRSPVLQARSRHYAPPVSKVALVTNHKSGSGGAEQVGRLLADAGAGVTAELDVAEVGGADLAGELVVVAGGDGSIAPVAARCAELGLPLAVIPVGTANDFAARFGLPSSAERAVEVAVARRTTRPVDLAYAGERPFVNVASLGLSPDAARNAEDLKDSLGPLAYGAGAVRASAEAEPVSCTVSCGEKCLHAGESWQVMVGCSGAFGGGSEIDAVPDDGMLDVVVFEGGPKSRLAKHAFGLRTGTVESQEGVHSSRCERARVEGTDLGEANVDGELVGIDPPGLEFRVEPRAFELVVE